MLIILVVLGIVVLDQLTKLLVCMNLLPGQSILIIKNIFYLTRVSNTGAAFGIFKGSGAFFIIMAVTVIIIILSFFWNVKSRPALSKLALGLILAGAIGNLIDRLRFGYVVDFLDFRIWPVFNIADSAITIGTILLILQMFKHKSVLSHKS